MDSTLLAKYIFGETTPGENVQVEAWLSESEAHRRELEQLQKNADLAARRYRYGTFDAGQAYRRLRSRTRHHAFRQFIRYYAAAAFFLLFLGSALFYYHSHTLPRPMRTITCAQGENLDFYLPDSTRVTLQGAAELSYPLTFTERERQVSMEGKIYFQVRKDPARPFVILSPSAEVCVLGTSFQVYATNTQAEILVNTGKVTVQLPGNTTKEILTAGMSAYWSERTGRLTTHRRFDVNKLAWKTKVFHFDDTPLKEVIGLLNENFQVNILLPENHRSLRLTATFDHLSLAEIIEIIDQTLDIHLSISQK